MRHLAWIVTAVVFAPTASRAAGPDAKAVEFFESKIRPVLVEQCYSCHSADAEGKKKLKGGLKLDTAAAVLKGGDSGPAVVPGKPKDSLLVKALHASNDVSLMPPKGKLAANVIADFEAWIATGAADPRTDGGATAKAGIDIEKGRQHWAFQPPKKATPPANAGKTDLDKFVLAKLAEKGLTPAKPADKRTILRRVYFDLIGLPPTPDEVEAFEKNPSPTALADVVNELLKSPRYGERWARHWLDVARYAEDQAHTFGVKPYSNAWQYRDWVIAALNADTPYDQFLKLQLAGDLMPESAGDPFTRLAGLGLLGLGAQYYGGNPTARADELDDKLDTVTRGMLGVTVACARCHDHKFDPIPTRDYYSLAGIFNGGKMAEAPLAPEDIVKKYDDAQKKVKEQDDKVKAWLTEKAKAAGEAEVARTAKYLTAVRKMREPGAKPDKIAAEEQLDRRFLEKWAKFLDPKNAPKLPPMMKALADAPAQEVPTKAGEFQAALASAIEAVKKPKPPKEQVELVKAILQDQNGPLFVKPEEVEKALPKPDSETLAGMKKELDERKKASPPMYPVAHVMKGGGTAMKVFVRGNPAKLGEPAPKRFLQVLSPSGSADPKEFTRLDLANAIGSKDNPLTARVIVNRVWAQHFGRGIVGTPSNFGKLGDTPTHPELLDYLAVKFMENGWSLKWLHREILLSGTYQMASAGDAANAEKDGDNAYLWRQNRRRLEVEPWRDSLLAVSGKLDLTTGGPTTDLRNSGNARRTVYGKISRHELDGLLRLFDFPDANVTADKRTLTTVPQQQLFAMNSEFMVTQAKAFTARVAKLGKTEDEKIVAAYRLAFGRKPSDEEVSVGRQFVALPNDAKDKLTRWEQYSQVLLAANEFLYVD